VLASEFNDFGGDLDAHSYEACLKLIEQADHFVLLIGGRVGGWYDFPNKISITQQEYRAAYERHKSGLLRIVTLVRADVWQLREDRKALKAYLADLELSDLEKRSIANYPTKVAEDAEFISKFLAEVGRNLETSRAVRTGGAKPTGNWIYPFATFKEVQDVLQPLVFTGLTSDEAAYRKALQHELIEVVRVLLLKHKDKPLDPRYHLEKHWRDHPIDKGIREDSYLTMDAKEWDRLCTVMFYMLGVQIEMVVIEDALTSAIFLEYDPNLAAYTQSEAYNALFRLVEEIRMLNRGATTDTLSLLFEQTPRLRGYQAGEVCLPTAKLAILYSLALRWFNVLSLSEALILHLEGRPFAMPRLMPFSPVHGMEEDIGKERVTAGEARTFLGLG